jgi:IS30 family transposase
MSKYSHLNNEDRSQIETGLINSKSFKEIGEAVGKDCTTISKEIRSHMVFRKTGAYGRPFNDCAKRKTCRLSGACDKCPENKLRTRFCCTCGRCTDHCVLYEKEKCPKLTKPPYVCNGCQDKRFCTLEKCIYDASSAQAEYSSVLAESRQGIAVSDEEKKRLDDIISPLILKGQSLHHICLNHMDELMVSERTLYTYMDAGLFTAMNIDMPRKVRLRPRRKRPDTIKVDPKCREGRTLDDYKKYMSEHPDTPVVQLDSVEGIKGGAVLLTVTFPSAGLQLAFRRDHNDAQSVIDIFDRMYLELGPDTFIKLFPVFLADNGSEFSDPKRIEFDANGNCRSRMFYCNASAPYQKGSCEAHHEMIRRVIHKGVDITPYTQAQITLMMNNINSYRRNTLANKSPYEVFGFLYGEDVLKKSGLSLIPPDEIILSPELLK